MAILGPQGTGERFLRFVAKMKAKGKTDLQARRIAGGSSLRFNRNARRGSGR